MNTKGNKSINRRLGRLLVVSMLVIAANLGSVAISHVTGLDLAPPAHACTNQGGGGDC